MKKTILILISSSILIATSCSKSDSSSPVGGGNTNSQYATLTCKIDGRTFTSTQGYGLYLESTTGGTTYKAVSFGHNSAPADESIILSNGSMVTVGNTHTFGKGSGQSDQAIYKKANSAASDIYAVSQLSSTPKSRFTYKIIRIFDNPASTVGKSVEFDFSGVFYKNSNANDSVVITDGTLRY